jgi:hypothetical protein
MKPTDLWGDHPPMTYRRCRRGDSCHIQNRGGNHAMRDQAGNRTSAERAKVPRQLSEAILDAVEGRSEQTTLTAVADGGRLSPEDGDRDA